MSNDTPFSLFSNSVGSVQNLPFSHIDSRLTYLLYTKSDGLFDCDFCPIRQRLLGSFAGISNRNFDLIVSRSTIARLEIFPNSLIQFFRLIISSRLVYVIVNLTKIFLPSLCLSWRLSWFNRQLESFSRGKDLRWEILILHVNDITYRHYIHTRGHLIPWIHIVMISNRKNIFVVAKCR
jgi:hypothetical protein